MNFHTLPAYVCVLAPGKSCGPRCVMLRVAPQLCEFTHERVRMRPNAATNGDGGGAQAPREGSTTSQACAPKGEERGSAREGGGCAARVSEGERARRSLHPRL